MARRKSKNLKHKKVVAVIGEGPTEWHYINDLKSTEKYDFKIKPELPSSSDFKKIFQKAKELVEEGYDKVYCLIDLDKIVKNPSVKQSFIEEESKIKKIKKIEVFKTMPCTEYWFLLHFKKYSTKIFLKCKKVENELRNELPGYQKTTAYMKRKRIYRTLIREGDLDLAKSNAKRLRASISSSDSPYSEVDKLLDKLESIST